MRLAHCAQVVPYIHTRMLRVTSFDDEVLSHVRERVATNQAFSSLGGLGLQYSMDACCTPVALSLRTVGRRLVLRHFFMRSTTKQQEVRCLSPWPSSFTSRRGRSATRAKLLLRERSRQEPTPTHTRTFGACRSHVPAAPLPPPRSLAHVPCTRATCTRSSCVSLRFSAAFLCVGPGFCLRTRGRSGARTLE